MLDAGFRKQGGGDLLRSLGAHVEDLGVGREWGAGLLEESFHGARVAGGDAEFSTGGDGLKARIAMRSHLAEVGDGFKAGLGGAELLQNVVFHAGGHDLGVSAAAVENGGGGRQRSALNGGSRQFGRGRGIAQLPGN